ncbi:hypothetical protein ACR79M_13095 [Sphingobacterium spiritivorum]|uniref:hypothetical protein n=1 Tax=Sphingobacterium TaxID=28453 RepID=UPI0025EC619E|nr:MULTISPECIES: hypothetical protein [unclassified Sphingobacterium]
MQAYKYLTPVGNGYKLRSFISFFHVIIVVWWLIGIAIVVYSDHFKTGLSIIAFTSLLLVLVVLRNSKTRIFPDDKNFRIDTGVRGQAPLQYSFSEIERLEIQVIKWIFGIPIHVTLYVKFKSADKTKRFELASSFSKKNIQQLYNELEEVLNQ